MRALGFFVHDVLAHPVCALFWIVGVDDLGDWLHDVTVFKVNEADERWPRNAMTIDQFLAENPWPEGA